MRLSLAAEGAGLAAVLLPSVMVAELLFPFVPMSSSLKLILLLVALSVAADLPVRVSEWHGAHFLLFSFFILTALARADWWYSDLVRNEIYTASGVLLGAIPWTALMFGAERAHERRRLAMVFVIAVGVIGASIGLWKLYLFSQGVRIAAFEYSGEYPLGTALRPDYNLYALGLAIALSGAIWGVRTQLHSGALRLALLASVPLFVVAIAFTGSRRGILFLLVALLSQFLFADRRTRTSPSPTMLAVTAATVLVLLAVAQRILAGEEVFVPGLGVSLDVGSAVQRVLATDAAGKLVETRLPALRDALGELSGAYGFGDLLLGKGVGFLAEMGRVLSNESGVDYPHVFVLSALLHGGVVYTLALLSVVGIALVAGFQSRQEAGWLFTVFLLSLLFALSSSNAIYSTELLYFLVVVFGSLRRVAPGWQASRVLANA